MSGLTDKASIGRKGEDIACIFLSRKGYKIIERNYRRKWGEIDVIAVKNGMLRFVEIKAKGVNDLDKFSREINNIQPEHHADARKLRKLARTADLYMAEKRDKREYQIDVIGVLIDEKRRRAGCRIFESEV